MFAVVVSFPCTNHHDGVIPLIKICTQGNGHSSVLAWRGRTRTWNLRFLFFSCTCLVPHSNHTPGIRLSLICNLKEIYIPRRYNTSKRAHHKRRLAFRPASLKRLNFPTHTFHVLRQTVQITIQTRFRQNHDGGWWYGRSGKRSCSM